MSHRETVRDLITIVAAASVIALVVLFARGGP